MNSYILGIRNDPLKIQSETNAILMESNFKAFSRKYKGM